MNHPKVEEIIAPKTPTDESTSERVKDCPPAPIKKKEQVSTPELLNLDGKASGDDAPCSDTAAEIKPTRLFPDR